MRLFLLRSLHFSYKLGKKKNINMFFHGYYNDQWEFLLGNIEAKRTDSVVILFNKNKLLFFENESQKTKGFDSKLWKFCHS
jgi:hypothetical protein